MSYKFFCFLQPFWILHGQHKHDSGGHEKSAGQYICGPSVPGVEGRVTCVVFINISKSLNLCNCCLVPVLVA